MKLVECQDSVLKRLRTLRNYSQVQLAEELEITRQSYIKYENGSAEMPLSVVRKLSRIFDVDYSCIIDNVMPSEPEYHVEPVAQCCKESSATYNASIDISNQSLAKFSNVFLYTLKLVGAKPNVGQGVLFKLLYFMDFDFYEIYSSYFMGLSYTKGASGPTPVDFGKTIRFLSKKGAVEEIKSVNYQYDMVKFLPVIEPDLDMFSAKELLHVDRVLQKYSDKTSLELKSICEKDAPWQKAENRGILNYGDVFYRSSEMSVRPIVVEKRAPLDFSKYNTQSRIWNDDVQQSIDELRSDRG